MLFWPPFADTLAVSTVRKLLLAVLLVSLTGSAFGAGTFASFNATTTNASSTFATGTVILSNKVNSGTACFSATTGAGGVSATNAANCSALAFSVALNKPGTGATVDLDLSNAGSIDASALEMYWDGAAAGLCATVDGAGSYHGSGSLCPTVQFNVQEYTDATARTAGTTTGAYHCRFGANPGAGNTCDSSGTPKTLADLDDYFGNTVTPGNRFDLGTSSVGATGVLKAGTTRYFRINVLLPLSADNSYQGRSVTWGLTFNITQ
jgi:hypothetical protein